jgi:hypothetical protein
MANKFKSWFIRTGGIKSHFIEAGEGDPLILITAAARAAASIIGATTSRRWHAIFVSPRSDRLWPDRKPAIEYSYQAKVDQLASFMDTLCMDKVFLGGNSMALRGRALRPDRPSE